MPSGNVVMPRACGGERTTSPTVQRAEGRGGGGRGRGKVEEAERSYPQGTEGAHRLKLCARGGGGLLPPLKHRLQMLPAQPRVGEERRTPLPWLLPARLLWPLGCGTPAHLAPQEGLFCAVVRSPSNSAALLPAPAARTYLWSPFFTGEEVCAIGAWTCPCLPGWQRSCRLCPPWHSLAAAPSRYVLVPGDIRTKGDCASPGGKTIRIGALSGGGGCRRVGRGAGAPSPGR